MDVPLQSLTGCRVFLVEDEYFTADNFGQVLSAHGATLIGPVPTLDIALAPIQSEDHIDSAVLDINLRGNRLSRLRKP